MVSSPTFKQVMGAAAFILSVSSGADTLAVNHPSPAWWALFGGGILCGLAYAVAWVVDFINSRRAALLPSAAGPASLASLVNPHYASDLARLDRNYKLEAVAGRETVVIVVGGTTVCELLDRPVAAMLRDEIDRRGEGQPFRRAVILTWDFWQTLKPGSLVLGLPTVSIGAVGSNPLTGQVEAAFKAEGHQPWAEGPGLGAFQPAAAAAAHRVAIWGNSGIDTRRAVESWVSRPNGLAAFLRDRAGWG